MSRVHHTSRPTTVTADGVELCIQTFADYASPGILLVSGASGSMDRQAVIDYIVEIYAATQERSRSTSRRNGHSPGKIVDRTVNIASSMKNHGALGGGEPLRPRLGQIRAPTLVLHGTEDQLFPLGHGEALAAEIPGARLVPLGGMGHEMPPRPIWDQVVAAILEHTHD